jgi:hypothetical protein
MGRPHGPELVFTGMDLLAEMVNVSEAASRLAFQGSGSPRRPSSSRPPRENRSKTGQGLPNATNAAWTRFLNMVRWRTR